MKNKAICLLVALVAAVVAEGEKKPGNPIIDFFEAPLKAFRTKPGEAIAVFEPQVLKVATNTTSTSWFPGQGLGNTITDWIAQRVPLVATTTTKPESNIIVHLQSENENANKEKSRKQQANGKNEDDDDEIQEAEYTEDFSDDEIGDRQIHGVRYDTRYGYPGYSYGPPSRKRIRISIRNKNKNKDKHRYGQRYGVPHQSSGHYADDDYDTYEDPRPQRPYRRKTHRRRPERPLPQNDFLQPFQDLPPMTRPIRYGQNYMALNGLNPANGMNGLNAMNGLNPINNQMSGYPSIGFPQMGSLSGVNGLQGIGAVSGMNGLPGMVGIQGMGPLQGYGGLGGPGDNSQLQLLYPSQINGQIPLLIPIQSIPLEESSGGGGGGSGGGGGGGGSKKKKKNEEEEPPSQTIHLHIQATSNEPDNNQLQQQSLPSKHDPLGLSLQSLQSLPQPPQPNYSHMYVPVPMQQLGVQGGGIDSLPVQQFLPQVQIVAQHTHKITSDAATPQLMLVHEDTTPLNNKKPQRPGNNRQPNDDRNKPPPPPFWGGSFPQSDSLSLEDYYNKYEYVQQKQNGDRKVSVDDTYDSISQPFLSIEQEDEDDSPKGKSAEGRAQYYIPQKYYPLINSDSLLEVSNNGRFLLKSGRGLNLKLKENQKVQPVMIVPDQEDIYPLDDELENVERSVDADVAEERMDEAPEEAQDIKKEEEMLLDMPKEDSIQDVIKELMSETPTIVAPSEAELPPKKKLAPTTQKPEVSQDTQIGEMADKAEVQMDMQTELDTKATNQPDSAPMIAEIMPVVAEGPKPTTETFLNLEKSEEKSMVILAEQLQDKPSIDHRAHPHQGIFKSEVVHEKPNGHFIIRSGVVDSSAATKSNQNTNRGTIRFQTPPE